MDKPRQTAWVPPRGIRLVQFPQRPDRPHGVQWRVEGRRKTKTFPTREHQITFAKSLAGDLKRDGLAALRLNADEVREWRAFRALIGPDVDLSAVAACWERNKDWTVAPLTVREAIAAYTAAKTAEGVNAASISHYRPIFDRLEAHLGARNVGDVRGDDVMEFMATQRTWRR